MTDVPDWGTVYAHCVALGPKARVVVDVGHHAPGINIEFIVAILLRARRLGGFDFNSRFYADDDLMVGCGRPFPTVAADVGVFASAVVVRWLRRLPRLRPVIGTRNLAHLDEMMAAA